MPLREIESAPVRQHMFGNPFKINKNMIMDEVVMDEVSLVPNGSATGASASNQPAKGVKRPATPDSPGGPMASKRLRKGKQFHRIFLKRLPIGKKKTREIHFLNKSISQNIFQALYPKNLFSKEAILHHRHQFMSKSRILSC